MANGHSPSSGARSRTPATLPWLAVVAGALSAALTTPSCLKLRDTDPQASEVTRCATCHGDPEREGDYLERSAPPRDLYGASETNYYGVGAHQLHLRASPDHAAVPCTECHVVPDSANAPGHADDDRPAELTFGTLAKTGGLEPYYDAQVKTCVSSYCHGDAQLQWNAPRDNACGSCHGLPPPAPHPQIEECSQCHGEVIDAERHFLHPERHIDGVVDAVVGDCQSCHGSEANAAPPLDLAGNEATSAPGVGAHQTHLLGTGKSRPVPCGECHLVPQAALDPGHMDSVRPAELTFSGVAAANGAVPAYEGGTCQSTPCHGAVFPGGHASGGTLTTPTWTVVDGTQAACGSCHGLPPPPPHPFVSPEYPCHACHMNMNADDVTFSRPELHVDGVVTLQLPP